MNWNEVIPQIPKLAQGGHDDFGPELCFMEMKNWLAGHPHSDAAECSSPVLAAYAICINDSGQEFRDLMAPLVPQMIGTKNASLEDARLRHIVFGVAQRIVAPTLRGRINDSLVDAIMTAEKYTNLRTACNSAARAAYVADAADAGAVDVAYAARAADAGADAADVASAAAADVAADADQKFRETSVLILKEAIDLDTDRVPPQIDFERVERLKELVYTN